MATDQLLATIEELLEGRGISSFNNHWIKNSSVDEDTLRQTYALLRKYGLSNNIIASQAHLLGMNPETIEINYQHHVGLLRQNYQDRTSGRDLLTNQAQLLGISPETINTNVQYLHSLGINYNNAFLLGTTAQLKRQKMAWMLRELFDYAARDSTGKREAIKELHQIIAQTPALLAKSISALEKEKGKLKKKLNVLKE